MLKGLSPYLGPDLLKILAEMGHGDEIVLADAHFPGHTLGKRVLRADGVGISTLLDAIMPVFELDSYAAPLVMMQVVEGDTPDPGVEADYLKAVGRHVAKVPQIVRVERFAFYQRASEAYAVLMTGELRKYGNILLKKGVTPVS